MDLDAQDVGAYMLLLMAQWQRGGASLPDDEKKLQRIARAGRSWGKVWGNIERYFKRDDEGFYSQRLRLEHENVAAKRVVNSQNGALGGAAKALKANDTGIANATNSLQRNPSIPEPYPDIVKREAKASPKKTAGSRLPDDWFLPQDWGEWALSQGMSRDHIKAEADRFADYWRSTAGQKARKADWLATWRNWIRNAKTKGKPNGTTDRAQFDAAIRETAKRLTEGTIRIDYSSRDPFAAR
jgi:uncharacterized protein YdaU (DUF1376 family)